MNFHRLTAPDFFLGKSLIMIESFLGVIALVATKPSHESLKFARLILQVKQRYTMVKNRSLINLYRLVQRANQLGLQGNIVECGVWNGGVSAVMAVAAKDSESVPVPRTMWLFDSFEGLPAPSEKDDRGEKEAYFEGWCKGSIDKVKQVFGKLNAPLENVKIVQGWFDTTLKTAPLEHIAILHIDSDWYDSVKVVLDTFYDKVVPGGFVVLDDWGYWQGCNRAVAEYFAEHDITGITINRVGRIGAYFQKPG